MRDDGRTDDLPQSTIVTDPFNDAEAFEVKVGTSINTMKSGERRRSTD
jgi:hypothetical protein